MPSSTRPVDYLNLLWGISAVSRTDIWAVRTTDYGSTLLIAHWNGTDLELAATATTGPSLSRGLRRRSGPTAVFLNGQPQ